ncbi:MAG: efflux RND transporter periplasmic adaptor subunit [Clostridiales bacterium]|nr:efflux RND transporter periplasmic adaptor subunit [Clostridiales bacterium]
MDKEKNNGAEKKKKRRKLIASALAVLILAGAGVGAYLFYNATYYFKTQNASAKADMIVITPQITGKLLAWNVKEGDAVAKDQVLGQQDTSSLVNSSSINLSDMGSTAGSLVEKSMIKSPIDGQIIKSYVVEGETIAPGMEVAVVADMSDVYILANIEETSIFKIKQGQTVDISIDAYPGKSFTGYVKAIGYAAQSAFSSLPSLNTSGTYSKTTQLIPVKINLINEEDLPILLGMNATVRIHIKGNPAGQ